MRNSVLSVKAQVFFTDMRARKAEEASVKKLRKLLDASGVLDVVEQGDLVAIKVHLGTPGNQRHIRPHHVRVVVEAVRERGGHPFVTDTTGISLLSPRGDAVRVLRAAALNGFTPETVGAPIIVADGLKGFSGVKVRVDGFRLKEVEVAQAIAEADTMISLAHAKGHPRTGFGGALKNIGVGCLTKKGRAPLHLAKKPQIKPELCDGCGKCAEFCPAGAIVKEGDVYRIDQEKCLWACGCWELCPKKAITGWAEMHHLSNEELCIRVADAFKAVVDLLGRDKVAYVNLAYDITPHCDCFPWGDVPMVPDIGMLASKDPVAIDKACIDLINQAVGLPGSALEDIGALEPGADKLSALADWEPFKPFKKHGGPMWKAYLEWAAKAGLGSLEYELVKV